MSDGGKNGRLVLHSRVSGKLAEIERLRGALAFLLEEIDSLLSWKRDAILARYARDIGHLEHALYRLEAAVAELRYRVAFLQAAINRGEAVTAACMTVLDSKVAAEFEKTRREIERREDDLRKAERYLDGPTLSPEDARELKALYRRLCKTYHPDVCGNESGSWRQRWALLQHAYRAGDLALLQALAEQADDSDQDPPGTPETLDAEIERLRSRIAAERDRVAGMVSSPPFSYEEKLRDRDWVSEKQQELKQAIAANEVRRDRFQELYDTLRPSSATVH